jgi:hypothetical protein
LGGAEKCAQLRHRLCRLRFAALRF